MNNDNKCFFSVSLENGIVITGHDPHEVITYLHMMHSAFFELWTYYYDNGLNNLGDDAIQEQDNIGKAIDTIEKNLKL